MGNRSTPALHPLHKSVVVQLPPPEAFTLFTQGIAEWWPLRTHSVSADRAKSCGIEPRVGGEIFELRDDGERFVWGAVLAWDEPHGFSMSWHPGRAAESAQEVELRFSARDGGTLVELEHRNWASYGEGAEKAREQYDGGWEKLLGEHFVRESRKQKGTS